ncbi:MAG: hypothetical protein FJX77_16080 [Armatimonadetes bacterium]|nr:hypothetical protein [Armatimonadota bacterium]
MAVNRGASGVLQWAQAHPLLSVWILAFLVRVAAVLVAHRLIPEYLVAADTVGSYLPIARGLAEGRGFLLEGNEYIATRIPPLFPLWLSIWLRLFPGELPLLALGIANAAWRATGCLFLYRLSRAAFGERAAAWSTLVYLLDPWEALWVGYVLKESLTLPLFLFGVWQLSRLHADPTHRRALLAGAAAGLAVLARYPSLVLWPAGLLLLFLARSPGGESAPLHRRSSALLAVLFTAGMLVPLSPWLARNWRVTGFPVLSTEFIGRYLYTSNSPEKIRETGGYADTEGLNTAILQADNRRRKVLESESASFQRAVGGIFGDPMNFLLRLGSKVVNMWRPTFGTASPRNLLFLGGPYLLFLALSLAGLVTAWRRRIPCAVIVTPLGILVLLHLVFWAEIRNRQYLMPLLYCFAGLFLATYVRPRDSRPEERPGADGAAD